MGWLAQGRFARFDGSSHPYTAQVLLGHQAVAGYFGCSGVVSLTGWSPFLRRRLTLHSDQVTINDERATGTAIDEAAAELAELAVTRIDAADA